MDRSAHCKRARLPETGAKPTPREAASLEDRVLVVNVRRLPDELIRELIGERSEVRSVTADSIEELRLAICDTNANVVIVGVGSGEAGEIAEFVRGHAGLRVLAVFDDGARGIEYGFEHRERFAGALGKDRLMRLLDGGPDPGSRSPGRSSGSDS